MIETPCITDTAAQRTAFIHLDVLRSEMQHVVGPGVRELFETVAAQGVAVTGPWFIHHRCMGPERFDFEICVPVNAPVAASGRVQPGELRAARVARTVYHGGYEGLDTAWRKLMSWIDQRQHKPAEDLWECYVTGPEVGPDATQYRTELNRPLLA